MGSLAWEPLSVAPCGPEEPCSAWVCPHQNASIAPRELRAPGQAAGSRTLAAGGGSRAGGAARDCTSGVPSAGLAQMCRPGGRDGGASCPAPIRRDPRSCRPAASAPRPGARVGFLPPRQPRGRPLAGLPHTLGCPRPPLSLRPLLRETWQLSPQAPAAVPRGRSITSPRRRAQGRWSGCGVFKY